LTGCAAHFSLGYEKLERVRMSKDKEGPVTLGKRRIAWWRVQEIVLVFFCAVVCCGTASAQMGEARPNPECQLKMAARLPLIEGAGHYMVAVSINGKEYLMEVDTGSTMTSVTPAAADMLGLGVDTGPAQRIASAGETWSEHARIVPSFKLGPSEWLNLRVLTADMLHGKVAPMQPQLIGLIGTDVLSRYDVEFDFPAKQMTLYTAHGCSGWFVPWQGRYYQYSPESPKPHRFLLPVKLNGHPMRAVLDTGAAQSLVTKRAASVAGLDEQTLNKLHSAPGTGFGKTAFTTYPRVLFDSLTVGPMVYYHAPLDVGGQLATGDMLLGMDFMHSRRVWVSYSSERVFMQPAIPRPTSLGPASAPAALQ